MEELCREGSLKKGYTEFLACKPRYTYGPSWAEDKLHVQVKDLMLIRRYIENVDNFCRQILR